jgi:integrase
MAGHIKKRSRADGRITYQARIPSAANRRKDLVKTFERRKDAERWLAATAAALHRGDFIDPRRGDTPLRKVADEWRETWGKLAPKTRVGYESILNRHVLPAFGSARVSAITPKDVQDFANGLAKTHAPNTVRRVMDVLGGVLTLAVKRRYIAVSPAAAVDLASQGDRPEINPLTHAEIPKLIEALPEHWRLPVLLDAYTGLRAGELWALRRGDVDALRGELLVDEAIKEVTTKSAKSVPAARRLTPSLIIGPTKTYAKRRISVPPFLRELLADHLARPLPGGSGPEAFVFTTPDGYPVRHNLFYKRVYVPAARAAFPERTRLAEARVIRAAEAKGEQPPSAAKRKKVSPFRFHDLRHTCAAWLIAAGAHPLQIKLRLGHKEIRTTMDTYGHLFPSAEPELANLLDAGYRTAQNNGPRALSLRPADAEEPPEATREGLG